MSEELKILSEELHKAQEPVNENTIRQVKVIGRLEGSPNSWFAKWIRFGNSISGNFILLLPQTEEQIKEATNELNSIASEMQDLLSDYRPKYKAFIEASVKMFSHPIKKRGIIGIEEYFSWASGFQSLLLFSSQRFVETARNYQSLNDLSPGFAEGKARIVSMLQTMAADYLTSRELLQIVVETAKDVS